MTEAELESRKQALKNEVEARLPQMVELWKPDGAKSVILSQHAFAADYQDDEYRLLGMVIKYIGLTGRDIIIGGSA